MIELIGAELLHDLTLLDKEGYFFDLHNDYDCTLITYDRETVIFTFGPTVNTDGRYKVCLIFNEARITKFGLLFKRTNDTSTINSFYRGRFEEYGELLEYSKNGEAYFYIEFEEGDSFEIFAKKCSFTRFETIRDSL